MKKAGFRSGIAVCLAIALAAGLVAQPGAIRSIAETASGGAVTGSGVSGGAVDDGPASGGAISGGTTSDGTVSGGTASDGTVSGGAVSGGAISGGAISGGAVSGSSVALAAPVVKARGGSKRVRLSWKKVANADGYCIYSRPETSNTYTKTVTINDGAVKTYDKKSLTQNTTYYFCMTSFVKVNGVEEESDLSEIVSAKTAKVAKTSKKAKLYSGKSKFTSSPAYKTYKKMKSKMKYEKSFAIPGMVNTNVGGFACKKMVPQAICLAGSYLLISAYDHAGDDYSVVYVVSKSSKSYITTIILPSKAKVEGMAYDGTNIWISKGSSVACFPYSVVTEAVGSGKSYVALDSYTAVCPVGSTASYIGYYSDTLWVGSFAQSKSNMNGYAIADKTTKPTLQQKYIMEVPSKTQGITFDTDGAMVLTRSYRTKKAKSGYISQIRTYYPSYTAPDASGKILKNTAKAVTTMPPMVQGVAISYTFTYTLFSSSYYKSCKYPVDRVIALKTKKLL